jgi:hypothetical protein
MTLREVFDELAGGGEADPAGALADRGYGELPEPLLSEAIVSYADTAPVEVAEHLSPFVMVHSAVPVDGDVTAGDGLALLATAPEPIVADDQGTEEPAAAEPDAGDSSFEEFDFGHGAEAVDAWDAPVGIDAPEDAPADVPEADDVPEIQPLEPEQADPPAGNWLDQTETDAADVEPDDGGDDAGA